MVELQSRSLEMAQIAELMFKNDEIKETKSTDVFRRGFKKLAYDIILNFNAKNIRSNGALAMSHNYVKVAPDDLLPKEIRKQVEKYINSN